MSDLVRIEAGATLSYCCPVCAFQVVFRARRDFLAPMFIPVDAYEPMFRHVTRHVSEF
jgi:hypothetical protein